MTRRTSQTRIQDKSPSDPLYEIATIGPASGEIRKHEPGDLLDLRVCDLDRDCRFASV